MGLGDVSGASVPKVTLVAAPVAGGTICTRTFIPVRVHESIGVLGAVSVATALLLDGAAGAGLAELTPGQTRFGIEHPTGHLEVETEIDTGRSTTRGDPRRGGADRAQAVRRHRLPPEVHVRQDPAATRPPSHDVAHLGHIELLTPEPEASLRFFVDVLGLTENGREGNSVYLRTWDDYEHHTVKLTAHDTSGIRRVGLRASSQQALEARVRAIEASGLGISWKDGDPGIGPTYLFRDPDGHELELYWETEWYSPPEELKPALKNQAAGLPGPRRVRAAAGPRELPGRRRGAQR